MKTGRATVGEISGTPPGHQPIRVVDQVQVLVGLDPWFSLRGVADYTSLSVRSLRGYLKHPEHPLPCYRVNGKILVRRSDLDRWLTMFRQTGAQKLDSILDEILSDLKAGPNTSSGSHRSQPLVVKGGADTKPRPVARGLQKKTAE